MKTVKFTNEINNKYKKVQNNEPFSFKWIFKIEVIIILILLLFVFSFNLISTKNKFKVKYNFDKLCSILKKNENYNFEMNIDTTNIAISKNSFLSNYEKEFLKNVYRIEIIENAKYINFNNINNKLKNLEIYYNNFNKKINYNYKCFKNIAGEYNIFSNKIYIYDLKKKFNKPFNEINFEDKEIYFHELNHVLTDYTLSSNADLLAKYIENKNNYLLNTKLLKKFKEEIILIGKNIFTETINELFTREYIGIYRKNKIGLYEGKAYSEYMPYTYVLAEILNEDTLREFKFTDNQSIIMKDLLLIDDNFDKVFELISSINSLDYNLKFNNNNPKNQDIYKNIYESLSYFYEKKYNKKMEDDLIINSYLYNTNALKNENKKIIEDFFELKESDKIIEIIPKGYVSNDYKNSNNFIDIIYIKNGIKQEYKINDENRFLK